MAGITPLPVHGVAFADPRDAGRALRMSWHHEQDVVVLSIWRDDVCVGTAQLDRDDVPRLVAALVDGLAVSAPAAARRPA